MKTTNNKESYKIYDQTEAILKAKELLSKIKQRQPKVMTFRVDSNTLVQIREGKNSEKIITKLRNMQPKVSVIEQIEYGQYA